MEDRLERPIERLTQQINILGEKIKGTQSIIPSDGGSTFKREESPVLTPREKSRERQKAIEFGKALGIGNYASKGKLEDLTPAAIRPNVTGAATGPAQPGGGFSILGMIGKVIGSIFKVLNYVSLYKLAKPFIEKFFGKNVITDTLFAIFDPIVSIVDDLKARFLKWFKETFPKTYEVIAGIVDTVKKAFSWVWEKLKDTFNWVKSFFESSDKKKFLLDVWEGLKKSFTDMFTPKEGGVGFFENIKKTFNDVVDWIKKKWEDLTSLITNANNFFVNFNSIAEQIIRGETVKKATDFFVSAKTVADKVSKFMDWLEEYKKKVVEYIDMIFNKVMEILKKVSDFIDSISGAFNELKQLIIDKINTIADSITNVIESIRSGIESIKQSILSKIESIANAITGVIESVKSGIENIKQSVLSKVENIGNAITGFIDSVKSAVVSGIEGIKSSIVSIIQSIGNTIISIMQGVASAVGAIVSAAKSAASAVAEAPAKAAEWVGEKTGGVVSSVKEKASGVVNSIKESPIGKAASYVGDKVSGAWEATKSFFGAGKKANDFLVSKRGDFVNFSNQDNVLGFKDGGSIDRVLGRRDDTLISDTRQILIESRKQVSLLQKIVENTYNANLLLQKLNSKSTNPTSQSLSINQQSNTNNLTKFNRSEFDIETSPAFNMSNLAMI